MILIPLRAIPNQRFSFANGNDRWEIELKVATTSMICSVWLNDEVVLLGSRVVAGVPLIPYERLWGNGNFGILTDNDIEPWWEYFETTQQLVFWENSIASGSKRSVDIRAKSIPPSMAELSSMINTAMKIKGEDYYPPSWKSLQDAIEFALSAIRSHAPQEGLILLATRNLSSAMLGLMKWINIDFARGGWDDRIDFTRGSEATGWVNVQLKTFGINEPRFVTDPVTGESLGLLVEGQGTNLLRWSEGFTQGAWSTESSAVTETAMPSPVTGVNWKEVTTTTTGSYHGRLTQRVDLTPGKLTIYAFAKAANTQFMRFRFTKSGELNPDIIFDLGDGSFHVRINSFSVEVTPSSKRFGDAWFVTVTMDASHITPGPISVNIGSVDNKSTTISSAGNSFLLAAAQIEEGTHPTTYIPTEGSQVTRAEDITKIPTDTFPFNPDVFTAVVEWQIPHEQEGNYTSVFRFADADSTTLRGVGFRVWHGGEIEFSIRDNNVSITDQARQNSVAGVNKVAFSFNRQTGVLTSSANGSSVATMTYPGLYNTDYLKLIDLTTSNRISGGSDTLSMGCIYRRVEIYPRALSDAELQSETS